MLWNFRTFFSSTRLHKRLAFLKVLNVVHFYKLLRCRPFPSPKTLPMQTLPSPPRPSLRFVLLFNSEWESSHPLQPPPLSSRHFHFSDQCCHSPPAFPERSKPVGQVVFHCANWAKGHGGDAELLKETCLQLQTSATYLSQSQILWSFGVIEFGFPALSCRNTSNFLTDWVWVSDFVCQYLAFPLLPEGSLNVQKVARDGTRPQRHRWDWNYI